VKTAPYPTFGFDREVSSEKRIEKISTAFSIQTHRKSGALWS